MGCVSSDQFDDENHYVKKAVKIYKQHRRRINYKYLGLHYYYKPIYPLIRIFEEYASVLVGCENCETKMMFISPNKIVNSEGIFNFIIKEREKPPLYVYYNDNLYEQLIKNKKVYYININNDNDVYILQEDYTFENCTDFTNQDLEI